jgi:hypothetical protein
MNETKPNHLARRGRLFPEIKWTQEQKIQSKTILEEHYQRCKIIFDRVQPELLKTHYNWFIAVEPDSGDYFKTSKCYPLYFCDQRNRGNRENMIAGHFGSDGELFFSPEFQTPDFT